MGMIKNLYGSAYCKPLINNIQCLSFLVTSGVPQGCSLSGVLFNVAMIPLLAKLNCLPLHTVVRPYQLKAQKILKCHEILSYNNISSSYADDVISAIHIDLRDPNQLNNIKGIVAILNTYKNFSKVSALINNDNKTVFATRFKKDEPRFAIISEYLVRNHNSVLSNFAKV